MDLIVTYTFVFFLIFKCARCFSNETGFEESRVLSRRKRFLVFPEGSSFQLGKDGDIIYGGHLFNILTSGSLRNVFCVQTAALIPIGDIFLYGNTAAIAWNLPTDPQIFYMLKEQTRIAQRRGNQDHQKNIYYLDEEGKVIAKVPYKRTPIINPVFAKRSVENQVTYKEKLKLKIDRAKMHEKQLKEDFLKKHQMDRNSIEFHRNSRLSLFEKLETFFSALGQDGRQCVLHKLCKAGQSYTQQGTFLQEMLRAVFTLPKGTAGKDEYDQAHTAQDCEKLYPGCEYLQDPVDF